MLALLASCLILIVFLLRPSRMKKKTKIYAITVERVCLLVRRPKGEEHSTTQNKIKFEGVFPVSFANNGRIFVANSLTSTTIYATPMLPKQIF